MAVMRLSSSLLKICTVGTLALSALLTPTLVVAQATEPALKAAIISNMLLFVEWPARSSFPAEQVTICHQGGGPVVAALIALDGKAIMGKSLKIVEMAPGNAADCQALYVSPGNAAALTKTLTLIGSSPVFVATDSPEYLHRGTMLNLELVSGRIVFDIDLHSAQRSGLQLSSKALRLARQVIE
jgi:hypothetical protein